MNTLLYTLLIISSLPFTPNALTYYVNEASTATPQTGSSSAPFTSIAQAYTKLGAITCDLVLLGQSASISTTITFAAGSNYTIKPSTTSGYFPLQLKSGAIIKTTSAILTLQNLQIIELNLARLSSSSPFQPSTSSYLNFQSVLVRDIWPTGSSYVICKASKSFVNIMTSEFRNLTNVEFLLSGSPINATGSIFSNLTNWNVPLVLLGSYIAGDMYGLIFQRNTFQNIVVGTYITGFIGGFISRFNTIFEDFYVDNVTFNALCPFLFMNSNGEAYYDPAGSLTNMTVRNGIVKNLFENGTIATAVDGTYISNPLFVMSDGPSIFQLSNLTVSNAIFKTMILIKATPNSGNFLKSWSVLPYANIKDVTITDSRNADIMLFGLDTVTVSNLHFERTSIKDVSLLAPLFSFQTGHSLTMNNVTAKDVYGPVIYTQDVMNLDITDCFFNNMSSSHDISNANYQNILLIYKDEDPATIGLNPNNPDNVYLNNFNVNGYNLIDGTSYLENSNNTYVITVHSTYGKMFLNNSVWYNNYMGGLLSPQLLYLSMDNLTVESDVTISREKTAQHRGLQFVNALEVIIRNCRFQNNQNYIVFSFQNYPRKPFYTHIKQSYLTFENITVLNNSAAVNSASSGYPGLFNIYCPLKPVNVAFSDSFFYNNTFGNGLINSYENFQANVDFTNNTFDGNYASQSGGVFSTSTMRQTTSYLNIINNTFTNNKCAQNGAVYSFIQTDYKVVSSKNRYVNNSAGQAGGVAYGLRASFVFLEKTSYYENNKAGTLGGSWYLSANNYKTYLQSFKFSGNTFLNSTAQEKGGCIYLDIGSMTIDKCTFKNSQAGETGGDFYVSIGKTVKITKSNFTASYAEQGSFFYAEEIDKALSISGVRIRNIVNNNNDAVLLYTTSSSLSITDSVIENISSPLILLSNVTTLIKNMTVSQISCSKSSLSYCLLKATSSRSLQIIDSSFTETNSNVDLISLTNCTDVLFSNVTGKNMLKANIETDQIFALNAFKVPSLNIQNSEFSKIGFSGLKVKNSMLMLKNSNFSNSLLESRLLAFDDSTLSSAKLSQPIQFIVLETSSSTLDKVSFIENSYNTLVNGGAIQILGQGGAHMITSCTFENNQAANGGALYVQDQVTSIQIFNSQFYNNLASGNGGALVFPDNSVKDSLLISKGIFLQNTANFGGGIYIGDQSLTVDSSSFIENSALEGGAIATKASSGTKLVDLTQSTFTSNNASQGAAFIALGVVNYEYSTSSFQKNTAQYGGYIASVPVSLRLKIYYVEPIFLYLDSVTTNDLLTSSSTKLVYDSITAGIAKSVALTAGSYPNLLFEVSIIDAFGNIVGLTNDAQGEFKIESSSTSSNLVGMLGSGKFTYTNSNAYIFNSFSVKGAFKTIVTLSIKGTYLSQSSNNIESLPSLFFNAILDKCSVGQIYDDSTSICSSCSSRTYSFADPLTAKSCMKCLDNAVCMGGSYLYPAQGYWRIDESSENLIECPQSESCLGGSKDGGKEISLTGFCAEGYEGIACSSCADGYAKFGSNQSCINCGESKLYYVMFGGYLLIQAIAIISTVRVNHQGASVNASERKKAVLQSTLLKIVIDFVQILTLTSEFNFNFPSVFSYLLDGLSKIVPTNVDALSVDCFIAMEKGNNKNVFFNKVLVILSEPLAYMIIASFVWIIIFKYQKKPVFGSTDFKSKIILTIIVITYILQPGIIKIMFELFNCKNYGAKDDPQYYLVYDVAVQCWKYEHLVWSLCIGIPTLLFGLLAPFATLMYWTREKEARSTAKIKRQYTFIFQSYQKNAIFWEIVVLVRKVLLIITSVFITFEYLQAYLGFLILASFFVASYRISPYNSPELNIAEALSLASSALILYTGLYFARGEAMDTVSYMLYAIDIVSGLIFVTYSLYVFFQIFRNTALSLRNTLTRVNSKILTDKIYNNLKLTIDLNHEQKEQQTLPAGLQSPISIQSEGPLLATGADALISDRCFSTERPLKPLVLSKIISDDEGTNPNCISLERKENSYTELPIFSPTNQTGVELISWTMKKRRGVDSGLNLPIGEEEGFEDFTEMLEQEETVKSPMESVDNKLSKVLHFSKENWTLTLSKNNSPVHKKSHKIDNFGTGNQ